MRVICLFALGIAILGSCTNGEANSQKIKTVIRDSISKISKSKFRVLEFMADDKPSIALVDGRYKDFSHKAEFPVSVFITINTVEKNQKGHPTAAESKVFNTVEDSIVTGLRNFTTCYIAKTTMDGYRDLIFYISEKDQKAVSAVLAGVKNKFPRIKSYVFEKDPGWEAVSEFYTALDKAKQ